VAGMIADDGDSSVAPYPVVVVDGVVASSPQLDLTGATRESSLGTLRLEVAPFVDMGGVRGVSHGQLQTELDVDVGGLLLQVAKDLLLLVGGLGVEVVSHPGLQV
jgi:hypothetical protein